MKLEHKEGVVTATAESLDDIRILLGLQKSGAKGLVLPQRTPGVPHPGYPKHYRVGNRRSCDVCGNKYKGLVGIGIHKANAHGIKGGSTIRAHRGSTQCPHCRLHFKENGKWMKKHIAAVHEEKTAVKEFLAV